MEDGQGGNQPRREQWRFYATDTDARVARDEMNDDLGRDERAAMADLMKRYVKRPEEVLPREVEHLKGDLYALRVSLAHNESRAIFSHEGKFGQVLLALVVYKKKDERVPRKTLKLAQKRLDDWRSRVSSG